MKHISHQPNQKIASIGVGGGLWEVMKSFEYENVSYHLQDIDANLLNVTELNQTIKYFEKHFGKPSKCNFEIVIGSKFQTNLPSNYFDKVILSNSFHEFEYQQLMLIECKRILKADGILVIEEQIAQYKGEIHDGCGKSLFLTAELIEILSEFNFKYFNIKFFENKNVITFSKN